MHAPEVFWPLTTQPCMAWLEGSVCLCQGNILDRVKQPTVTHLRRLLPSPDVAHLIECMCVAPQFAGSLGRESLRC